MGMVIEFNWFMVVANENKIINDIDDVFYTEKSEKRVYPIGFQIPLIIKNIGCIGMIKIVKTVIDGNKTVIYFKKTEQFEVSNPIAMHYYDRYLDFKRRETEINP